MSKVLIVAKTEYLTAVRSKAFIIGVAITPLFIVAPILVQKLAEKTGDISDQKFAVVDHSGALLPVLEVRASARNETEIFDPAEPGEKAQILPRFVPVAYENRDRDRRELELELSDRVRGGNLFAFLIIGADAISGEGDNAHISYYTQTPTATALPDWINRVLTEHVHRTRFADAGVDRQLVARLNAPPPFVQLGLVEMKAGRIADAKAENRFLTMGIPLGTMFMLFMLVMMSAPALLNTVMEEKIQRISELLLSSASPFQLMLGKLIGTIFVALTLSVIYIGAAVYMIHRFGFLDAIPVPVYFWFVVFMILAMFMYGSIFAGIGAACSEVKDAQTLMGPAMIIIILPVFCWVPVMQSPNGPLSVWVSLFPPATPMIMMLRLAASPGPPLWQVLLALVLTGVSTLVCVWAGGKIFRIGLLSHGQTPTMRNLIGWVVSK